MSRLITRWRRLEIESWPSVLRSKEQRYEINALKVVIFFNCIVGLTLFQWWFHICGIVNDQNGGENDEEDKKILEDIFESLEKFVTSSNFGEFPTRLSLLSAFSNEVKAQIRANINPVK
jgi:midasin (ATPase involved in ribosome maturation)